MPQDSKEILIQYMDKMTEEQIETLIMVAKFMVKEE